MDPEVRKAEGLQKLEQPEAPSEQQKHVEEKVTTET
jgi:hypothetical protein